ncbi:MlaD family protein [Ramlibacter rhizophilus]|uniref:MCE family protein n=1 Tax=Ramlibacter rhizophilus TaxID=1781167 RepID=A0A4Z0BHI0_9BURK|nr:MlaD family protein [Ramlibacter rhizophilus]TFY97368.1 MCE family protein [Ramlibacter rhizophilus]
MASSDPDSPLLASEPAAEGPVPHLAWKARLLLLFTVLLITGATLYVLYARGVFEPTRTLVLTTDDSEGVVAGMDVTFSGFPIGRVRRVELGASGEVRILVDVAEKDAHWLRTSSVFTLVRGLVGGTAIKAYSGVLTDPPLPDGAERQVLRGDATADIPRVVASAREVMENLSAMTRPEAELRRSLAQVQAATERLNGPRGALGLLFGNDADARKLVQTLERTNALLARTEQLAGKADAQVFGQAGLLAEFRGTAAQLNGLLADTRASLRKIDTVLQEAQGIATNVRGATGELDQLRGEVEGNLRKIDALVDDLNRRWPFARERELKLP